MSTGGGTRIRKVSVREEVYRLLQELQQRYGATSLSDAILLLAEKAGLCESLWRVLRELEERLNAVRELDETLRKTYLLLARLTEELSGRQQKG